MADSNAPVPATRRSASRWPVRLLRLPFDLLFLTWDFLRLLGWALRNLPALLTGNRPAPFAPLFANGVIESTTAGTLWYCSLAPKYASKGLLRLLFRRLLWHQTADGRVYLCWRGSRSESPTSTGRLALAGVLLACLWLVPAAALVWHYRAALPLPGFALRGGGAQAAPRSPAPARDPAKAAQALAKALEQEKGRHLAEARTLFQDAAALDATLVDAQLGVGRTAQALDCKDEARQAFERALSLDPASAPAMLGLAKAHRSQGADAKALEILARLTAQVPDCAEAYVLESSCRLALGDVDQAAAAIDKALNLAPRDLDALAAAGDLALRRGLRDQAEPHFRALVDADPKDARGRVGLARVARLKGNLPEARALLLSLLADKPAETSAIEELVDVQAASGRPLDALATCRKAMADYPDQVRLREKHLGILFGLGRDNELYLAGSKLLDDHPGNLSAHLQLAAMFLRRGLPALAIEHCDRAIAQQAGLEPAHRLLTSALILAGEVDVAMQRLDEILKVLPQDLDSLLKLGECHRRKNDIPKAVAILRQAVEIQPGSPVARSQLAQALFLAGDSAGALAEFREAQRLSPDDPKSLNNTAAAIAHTGGNLDEALGFAEKARFVEPANPQILDTLAWVLARRGTPDQALPPSDLATALQPDSAIVRYHHGAILAALGRRDAAVAELRAALASGAEFHGSADAKVLLEKLSGETGKSKAAAPAAGPL